MKYIYLLLLAMGIYTGGALALSPDSLHSQAENTQINENTNTQLAELLDALTDEEWLKVLKLLQEERDQEDEANTDPLTAENSQELTADEWLDFLRDNDLWLDEADLEEDHTGGLANQTEVINKIIRLSWYCGGGGGAAHIKPAGVLEDNSKCVVPTGKEVIFPQTQDQAHKK